MRVDRESRGKLVAAIERFLSEKTWAFEFDKEIFEIAEESHDPTVSEVVNRLWFHYDDLIDHPVSLTKLEWDGIQRLVLVLESDAHFEERYEYTWSFTQILAAMTLATFGWFAYGIGFNQQLFLLAIPFGVVSIALSSLYRHEATAASSTEPALTPFATIQEIARARRKVSGFRKQRYPAHLKDRRIHGPVSVFIMQLQTYTFWLLLSPVALLNQMFPGKQYSSRIAC